VIAIRVHRAEMERLVDTTTRQVVEEVHDTTRRSVERIRAEWPVDTGESRDSWRAEERGQAGAVTNDEPYVQHVHDGRAIAQALDTWRGEVATMPGRLK
jgi:hypothetical protein